MADGDAPSDWEALCTSDTGPYRIVFPAVEVVYEDDRQFPDCIVLRSGGKKCGIVPKENLLALRRLLQDAPPEAPASPGRPTPLDLSRAGRKDRP